MQAACARHCVLPNPSPAIQSLAVKVPVLLGRQLPSLQAPRIDQRPQTMAAALLLEEVSYC